MNRSPQPKRRILRLLGIAAGAVLLATPATPAQGSSCATVHAVSLKMENTPCHMYFVDSAKAIEAVNGGKPPVGEAIAVGGTRILVALTGRPHRRASEAATPASLGAPRPSDWAKNGATACKKLLTADFLGAILASAPGQSEARADGVSCGYLADSGLTNISIALSDHITLDVWEQYNKQQRPKDIALAGIGDKAIRSDDGALIGSWKKGDRTCGVYLVPIRETPKLTGEALAKKLGGLCNQLFAMP